MIRKSPLTRNITIYGSMDLFDLWLIKRTSNGVPMRIEDMYFIEWKRADSLNDEDYENENENDK